VLGRSQDLGERHATLSAPSMDSDFNHCSMP
jgi:hypothetical protein